MSAKTPERDVLPAKVADRLLARASELDAGSSQIEELKQAAMEAGISEHAFEAALAEYRDEKAAGPKAEAAAPRRRNRFAMIAALLLAGGALWAFMRAVPSQVQVVDPFQTRITLSCTTPQQARNIAGGILDLSVSTMSTTGGDSPSLTISAPNQEMIDAVRAAIAQAEQSCAVPPPGTATPKAPGR